MTIAALVLAALAPTAASADHGERPYSPFYSRVMDIARAYWNDGPNLSARCRDPATPFDAISHLAYFQHPDPSVFADSEKPGCRIWLDVDWWSNATRSHWHCEAIVHEYGHLLGMEDSGDPASVMYPGPKYGGKVFSCHEFGPAPVWDAPAASTAPPPVVVATFKASPKSLRVSTTGRFSYPFVATALSSGRISLKSTRKLTVGSQKRFIYLPARRFAASSTGKVKVAFALSRTSLRALKRARQLHFRVSATITGKTFTTKLTLKAPTR